ncbi:hypothetical protein SAMD00079811_35180 [Scytonema sp. HK-05]|uniref:hypothetical protein n=1 Tax=Scytonema sp. HK-05 TaxID=1137095 RepID=UPI000937B268|nr:hypothetical protein [Scytonema sp. HK-05]OKH51556.1 hypothetical protein NIES2130_33540 [Scytonema sp. HK-05]BAY45911.1 hypothetical protein SAMD00079811_35180 [Scytonema sp. HK-05]
MQIEKRLKNHYRRWNIDLAYEEEFLKFKYRLVGVLDKWIGNYLISNSDVDRHFLEIFNFDKAEKADVIKSQPVYKPDSFMKDAMKHLQPNYYTKKGFGDTNVYKCINDCETSQKLATALQFLFWVLEERHNETRDIVSEIVREIRRLSVLTPSASFEIYRKGKQVIVYPYGDQFLDRGIIDSALSGLEDYPEVAGHFEKALKIYQSGETSQYRNLLDNLRFALEQLLKKILKNQKSLENQKNHLLPWLREKGLHSQVVNLYEKLLSTYQDYQNDAVKHNEAFSLDEVEFMIYLTGNFMRLILQLARQVNNVTE